MKLTQKQIKNTWIIAVSGVLLLGLLTVVSPFSGFFKSSILNKDYISKDAGLYQMIELNNGTVLQADVGATLRSDNVPKGTAGNEIYVDVSVVTGSGGLLASTVAGIVSYDKDRLTVGTSDVVFPVTGFQVDPIITKVMRDASNNETGQIYFMVTKTTGKFIRPSEKAFTLKFIIKNLSSPARVSVDTVRIRDFNEQVSDATSLFLDMDETQKVAYVPLLVNNNGNRIELKETLDASGRKIVKETYFTSTGAKLKDVETIRNVNGTLFKLTTTNPDGSYEMKDYLYNQDGSYSVITSTKTSLGAVTSQTSSYKADGTLISAAQPSTAITTAPTGTTATTATAATTTTGLNNEFFQESSDKLVKVTVATGSLLTSTQMTILALEDSQLVNLGVAGLSKGYRINAFIPGASSVISALLNPMQVTIKHTPLAAGKSADPYYYDEATKKWNKLTKVANTEVNTVMFKTLNTGSYILLSSDVQPLSAPSSVSPTTATSPASTVTAPSSATTVATPVSTATANILSGVRPSASACETTYPFSDTQGHWSAAYVERARVLCIIGGKFPGLFAPDDSVTRAELTKIAINAFEIAKKETIQNSPFTDVSPNEWHAIFIDAAWVAKLIDGYNDGTFKPNANVNRAEALKIILEAAGSKGKLTGNIETSFDSWKRVNSSYRYVDFPDTPISAWFAKYVRYAVSNKVISGYQRNGVSYFEPSQAITRAEAVKIIMQLIGK